MTCGVHLKPLLVALAPPWVPCLEQAAAHVVGGAALRWNLAQTDGSLS